MQPLFLAISLSLALGLTACCPATAPLQPAPPEAAPTDGPTPTPPATPDGVVPAPDASACAEAPEVVCCLALTPECEACQADASRRRAEFEARCGAPSDLEPMPETFDCTIPPPLAACCRALLPRCTACVERNRAIEAAWRQFCAKLEPGEVSP